MIGPDPFALDGLDDLQRESLRLREELERKFCDPLDEEYEPETINEAHWWVQPKWVKYLSLLLGVPVALIWAYEVRVGDMSFPGSPAMFICIGAICLIAALQLFFIIRAYWRMDI